MSESDLLVLALRDADLLAGVGLSTVGMVATLALGWLRPPPRRDARLRLALGERVSGRARLVTLVAFVLVLALLAALALAVHELVGPDEVRFVAFLVPWVVPVLVGVARSATRRAGRGWLVSTGRKVELVWDGVSRRCPPGVVAERVRAGDPRSTGFLELYLRDDHGEPLVLTFPLRGELADRWGRKLLAAGVPRSGRPDPRAIPVLADLHHVKAMRRRLVDGR